MKVLIWVLSLFVFTLLNMVLGEIVGVRLGGVLLYLVWYYSARAMSKAWEKSRINKKAEKCGVSAFAYIKSQIPEEVLVECDKNRGNDEALKVKIKQHVKAKQISRAYADILLDEYMQPEKTVEKEPAVANAVNKDTTDKVRFCRKCGEKLIDGSRFCRKCGTEVVEISQ